MDRQFPPQAHVAPPAHWAARLERERYAAHLDSNVVRDQFAILQRQFQQLVRQIKLRVGAGQLPAAEQSLFATPIAHILENSRLLFAELNRIGADDARLAPPDTLDELLQATQSLLERLERQFKLSAECDEFGAELHRFCQRLLYESRDVAQPIGYSALRPLVASVRARERHLPSFQELQPALAILRLERHFGRTAATVYVAGLLTASHAAQVARSLWLREDHVELLISAALLHDVGLLALPKGALINDDDIWHPLRGRYERHPLVGHALLEGLDCAPTALGHMASLHHERLNGTGYPRGRQCGTWTELAELLAVLAHWHQLRSRHLTPETGLSSPEECERSLVEALAKETRRGAFRPEIVARALSREVDPSWLGDADVRPPHAGTSGSPPAPHLPAAAPAPPPLEGPAFRRAGSGGRRRGRIPGRRAD